jgi:FkbM family methyltransferase
MSVIHSIQNLARGFTYNVRRYAIRRIFFKTIIDWMRENGVDGVLDVGANAGQYAAKLRRCGYKGQVFSFEPQAAEFARLKARATRDGHHGAFHCAVGDVDGEITLNIAGNSVSSSILPILESHVGAEPGSGFVREERVPIRRLDGLFEQGQISGSRLMLKIDTQGYEMPVLLGAESVLPRIAAVQVELSATELYEGASSYLEVCRFLSERGYSLFSLQPGFTNRATGQVLQFDGFFIRQG